MTSRFTRWVDRQTETPLLSLATVAIGRHDSAVTRSQPEAAQWRARRDRFLGAGLLVKMRRRGR